MNPVITEQLNKFKAGDFSGYEGFYNETVNTVYTMLHTIVNDQNVATSLVSQVYDKIYQNATSLEQTEGFYQWAAGFANEEALGYLKEHNLAGAISAAPESGKVPTEDLKRIPSSGQGASSSDQGAAAPDQMASSDQVPSSAPEATEQFCDYAVGDEELMVTEAVVEDNAFVAKLQEIVGTLTPIERVIFQDYYYFGIGVPEIAAKTGCKDTDIRYTLSRTRTSIVQAITASPAYAAECGNPNIRRYRLAEAPWMWIAYQNFLGYTLGIDTVSIAGWSLGVLGQAAGSGIAIGTGAEGIVAGGASGAGVEGAAGTMAGAGSQGAAGAMAGAGAGGAAAAGASGASGIAAGILGTIGGKIALGVIGAALVTGIGFGVHHVVTERQATTEATTEAASEDTSETTTEATTEAASETTTEATTETTTEEVLDENVTDYASYDEVLTDLKQQIEQYDPMSMDYSYEDTKFAVRSLNKDAFYAMEDLDGDGTEELLIGSWNTLINAVDVADIYTTKNGKIVKLYSYEDGGQGAAYWMSVVTEDGSIFETNDGRGNIQDVTNGWMWSASTDWKIEDGSIKLVDSCISYGVDIDTSDEQCWNIRITDETAYKDFMEMAAKSDLATMQAEIDAHPEKYTKEDGRTSNAAAGNAHRTFKWQPVYDDNSVLNYEYGGPQPDADGRF